MQIGAVDEERHALLRIKTRRHMNCPSQEIALSISRRLSTGVALVKGTAVPHFNRDFGTIEAGSL